MRVKILLLTLVLFCFGWVTSCQKKTSTDPFSTPKPTTSALLRKIPTQPFVTAIPEFTSDQVGKTSDAFVYPGGAFQLTVPEGWDLDISEYGSVFISEPGGEGAIYITVTNTGYPLGSEAFKQFLNAREENFFTGFSGYEEIHREIDEENTVGLVEKKVLFNEIPDTVGTYYFAQGQAVFVIDLWMETANELTYKEMYQPIIDSFQMEPEAAKDFLIYNFIFEFRDSTDQFSFEVPISWLYETLTVDGSVIDNFFAPDNLAYLQHHIFYSDVEAGQDAIFEKIYQANQTIFDGEFNRNLIEIERTLDNGGTYIKWNTADENWQFESVYFFENGKVFALSGLIQKDYLDVYQTTIDYGFDWYSVPAAK